MFDLSTKELDTVYDELNALVWGYHKADPENARAQFSGVFRDYDTYIRELDAIMEEAAQTMQAGADAGARGLPSPLPSPPSRWSFPGGISSAGRFPTPARGPQYLTGPESSVGGAREGFDPGPQFQLSRSDFCRRGPTPPVR